MNRSISVAALALAAVLAGCAGQQVGESQYVPAQGGPGYGGTGDVNNVPGQRPPPGADQPQGSSGSGVSGSGNSGTYGSGESGSAPASTGSGTAGVSTDNPDMQKMCALEGRLQAAHSEQERQAILDQAMPGATPDLRQQHLEMLRQQCH